MNIIIGKWRFCPRLLTSLFALVFFCLFILLGFWQLDRADQKRSMYAEFEARQTAPVLDLNNLDLLNIEVEEWLWRYVNLSGEFLHDKQLLLDNQVNKGEAGYFVYSLLRLTGINQLVLINRGWLPAGVNRSVVPDLTLNAGPVNLYGVIKKEPKTGVLLKEQPYEKMNHSVLRTQRINLNDLSKEFGETLLPFIIRLEPGSDHGYVRQWRLPGSGEEVHVGYAFQWFAFAATLLVIYICLNIKNLENPEKKNDEINTE